MGSEGNKFPSGMGGKSNGGEISREDHGRREKGVEIDKQERAVRRGEKRGCSEEKTMEAQHRAQRRKRG